MGPHPHKTVLAAVARGFMALSEIGTQLPKEQLLQLVAADSVTVVHLIGVQKLAYGFYDESVTPAELVVTPTVLSLSAALTTLLRGSAHCDKPECDHPDCDYPNSADYVDLLVELGVDPLEVEGHVARVMSE